MKLTELAYRCVKSVYFNDDISFTIGEFTNGDALLNSDYTMLINNVYTCINEAIARLNDLDKIPHRLLETTVSGSVVDLSLIDIKEVVNVAIGDFTNYVNVNFSQIGLDKIKLSESYNTNIMIEYKEDIPYFDDDSIEYETNTTYGKTVKTDVDLKKYGITNSMCNYIIEYTQGKLSEQSGESVANMHITRSEQYFNNIPNVKYILNQQVVSNKYSIDNDGYYDVNYAPPYIYDKNERNANEG